MRRVFAVLLSSIALACGLAAQTSAPTQNILILGDSLTAGYGLPDPATQAYPALLQEKIDALAATASEPANPTSAASDTASSSSDLPAPHPSPPAPIRWRVVNAGLSGDTTSGGLRRIDWVLRQPVSILVLALGSNDGLRGLDPDLVSRNLAAIAAKVRAKNPDARVLLLGQRMPTSMGDYAARFDAVFPALAREQNWTFVPFLLEGVGGVREFNQSDAIHPNVNGHLRMADTVWSGLAPLLGARP